MQYEGKIAGRVFKKGSDGSPVQTDRPLALFGIAFNGDSVEAVEAVIEELKRQIEVVRTKGF